MPKAKKAKAVDPGPLGTYNVLQLIDHDGDGYAPGEPIQLYAYQAKPLLAIGAISPVFVEVVAVTAGTE